VSPPTFLVDPEVLVDAQIGGTFVLDGSEGHHAVTVQRLRVGEQLDVVDGFGRRVRARIAEPIDKSACAAAVIEITDEPDPHPLITTVQAVAKGDRGERAVQMLTEAGVDVVIPWQAENCIATWQGERAIKHRAKWQSTAKEAGKQSRRARLPVIEPIVSTAAVVDLIANTDVALVLDERSQVPLTSIDISSVGDLVLVVGPEGGLSDTERTVFAEAGADLVRLGPTVLRTSTAGVAALGVVMARVGRW